MSVPGKGGETVVKFDEQPFKAKLDKIPGLKPAFKKDGTITAATSSSISDGAAALVLMRESSAARLGSKPIARIVAHSVHAQAPSWFTTAPVGAIEKVLKKAGWSANDVDLWEVNEAFAAVTMAAMTEFKLSHDIVNVHGGAVRARPSDRRQRRAHRRHAARRAAGSTARRRASPRSASAAAKRPRSRSRCSERVGPTRDAVLGTHSPGLFAATVFVVNATPGVDMLFVATRTLRHGVAGGIAAALGVAAGCVVHTLVAAFGLAALLAASSAAFALVKWAGAAYLLWLAIGMLREGVAARSDGAEPGPVATVARVGPLRLFRQGLVTNVLNPKVALFFLALLPQFIAAASPHKLLAFLFLGAWFVVQGALFLIAFVLLVAPLGRWRAGTALRRGLHVAGAGLFAWLALRLALVERA